MQATLKSATKTTTYHFSIECGKELNEQFHYHCPADLKLSVYVEEGENGKWNDCLVYWPSDDVVEDSEIIGFVEKYLDEHWESLVKDSQ